MKSPVTFLRTEVDMWKWCFIIWRFSLSSYSDYF